MPKDTQIDHDPHNALSNTLEELRLYVGLPADGLDHLEVINAEHRFGLDVTADLQIDRAVHALEHGAKRYQDRATAEKVANDDMAAFVNSDWSKNALARPDQSLAAETPVLHRSKAPFAHQCDPCGGHGHYTCGKCSGHGDYSCPGCGGHGWHICNCRNGRTTCYGCSGSGSQTVSRTVQRGNWQEAVWETVRCSSCGGSGLGGNCGRCGGTSRATCYGCHGRKRINCNGCGTTGKIGCDRCGRTGTATSQLTLTAVASLSNQSQNDPDDPVQEKLFPGGIPHLVGQPGFEYTRQAEPQSGKSQSAHFDCLGRTSRAHDDQGALALSWGSHLTVQTTDRFREALWAEIAPLAASGSYQKLTKIPAGRDILACGIGKGPQKEAAESRLKARLPDTAQAAAISAGADIDHSVRRGDGRRCFWMALLALLAGFASWSIASVNIGLEKAVAYLEAETGNQIGEIRIGDSVWMYLMLGLAATILVLHLWRKARRRRRRFKRIVGNLLSGRPRLKLGVIPAFLIAAASFSAGISMGPALMPILQGVPEHACPMLSEPADCLGLSWSVYTRFLEAGLGPRSPY